MSFLLVLLLALMCPEGFHSKPLNSLIIKVVADIWANNQWKENAFIFYFRKNACQAVRTNVPGFYEQVFKKETKGACALKGVYEVNNTPVNWTFPNVPIMPYANYRLRIMLGKAENMHAFMAVDCKTIPKFE